jgi:hypothetical protein
MASKKDYQSADKGQIAEYKGKAGVLYTHPTKVHNPPASALSTASQSHGHVRNS